MKLEAETTNVRKIEAGKCLGPVLYFIYTSDLPTDNTTAATFIDGIEILTTHEPAIASLNSKPPKIRPAIGRRNGELK
jgi:hypothetical protein